MASYAKVSSSWKTATSYYVKVGGAWKTVSDGYVKVAGAWKTFFTSSALSLAVSNVTATNATFTISSVGYAYFRLSISPAAFSQQDLGATTTYTTAALSANTSYTATVQGWTSFPSGFTTTATATFYTTPATPSLSVSATAATSVTVSWSAISGATAYYVSTNGSTYTSVGNVTSYTFTGLTTGTAYTFYVKAYNSSTALYGTAGTVSGTPTAAPGTPTQSATSTDTSITISWAAGTGTTGSWKLYVWSSLSPLTNVASSPYSYTTATTSLTISSGLSRNTPYYYQILAYSGAGQTGSFTYASPDTNTIYTKLQAPSLNQGATYTSTSAEVTWSAITGATSYQSSTDGSTYTSIGNVTSYTFTGLGTGSTNTLYIRAANSNTVGMPGSATIYTSPATPTQSAGSITQTTATISWSGATGAGSYKLYVRQAGTNITSSPFDLASNVSSQALTGLTAGTAYTYQILAYTKTDQTGPFAYASPDTATFTTTAAVTTIPNAPTGLSTPSSGTAPNLVFNSSSWSAPSVDASHSAAAYYQVYVEASTSSSGPWFAVNSNFKYYASAAALSAGTPLTTATNAYTVASAATVYGTSIFEGRVTSTSNTYTWVRMFVRAGNSAGYSAWVSAVG